MVLARETLLLGTLCLADLVITALLISTGFFTEGNPILAHYLQYGLFAMCLVKLFSFVVPLTVAEWYRRSHPRFIRNLLRATLYLYVIGYVTGIAAINAPILMTSF
jgi:hypothetical protein